MALPYTKTGPFSDLPTQTTPITAAFLNAIEAAVLQLMNDSPATSEVPVWDGSQFVASKVTNAMVDAAAAIAYSKLNLTGGITNADINAAAAIAYSKLSLTNSVVNADISSSAAIDWAKMAQVASSAYTPTLTQSGTVTKTSTYTHFFQIGKMVVAWVKLDVTGSGTANNVILLGLPVAAVTTYAAPIGFGEVNDATGSVDYPGQWYLNNTTTARLFRTDIDATDYVGKDPNFALASGDAIYATLIYESA